MSRFARQQWRARIETVCQCREMRLTRDSPASNGGRGLKHPDHGAKKNVNGDSPASNGGRGLKLSFVVRFQREPLPIRPPAMAGAD